MATTRIDRLHTRIRLLSSTIDSFTSPRGDRQSQQLIRPGAHAPLGDFFYKPIEPSWLYFFAS